MTKDLLNPMGKYRLFLSATGALLAWLAVINFYVVNGEDKPFLPFFAEFFTYFTIVGNLAIALYFTLQLFDFRSRFTSVFFTKGCSTAIVSYITFVSIGYHTLFEDMYEPEKITLGIDLLLHLVNPLLYLIYWWIYEAKKDLEWNLLPLLLILPFLYIVYVLLVGIIFNEYPYEFFDVDESGYLQVILFSLGFCMGVALIGAAFIGLARMKSPRKQKGEAS
jgi:ABC-type cobalt transport system substrate-binding protein